MDFEEFFTERIMVAALSGPDLARSDKSPRSVTSKWSEPAAAYYRLGNDCLRLNVSS